MLGLFWILGTGAEVQAGAASPLARIRYEDDAPELLMRAGERSSPLSVSFEVLPPKQARIYPVPRAIWKQIKSFHQLFLIEPDKPG